MDKEKINEMLVEFNNQLDVDLKTTDDLCELYFRYCYEPCDHRQVFLDLITKYSKDIFGILGSHKYSINISISIGPHRVNAFTLGVPEPQYSPQFAEHTANLLANSLIKLLEITNTNLIDIVLNDTDDPNLINLHSKARKAVVDIFNRHSWGEINAILGIGVRQHGLEKMNKVLAKCDCLSVEEVEFNAQNNLIKEDLQVLF